MNPQPPYRPTGSPIHAPRRQAALRTTTGKQLGSVTRKSELFKNMGDPASGGDEEKTSGFSGKRTVGENMLTQRERVMLEQEVFDAIIGEGVGRVASEIGGGVAGGVAGSSFGPGGTLVGSMIGGHLAGKAHDAIKNRNASRESRPNVR